MSFFKYYKTIGALILILVLSLMPGNSANKLQFINFPYFDKIVHFFLYFIFSWAIFSDFSAKISKKYTFIILFSAAILGGSIEIIQNYFIPGRSGDWFDLIADVSGSLAFLLLFLKTIRKK